jgi:hypothetical protein
MSFSYDETLPARFQAKNSERNTRVSKPLDKKPHGHTEPMFDGGYHESPHARFLVVMDLPGSHADRAVRAPLTWCRSFFSDANCGAR